MYRIGLGFIALSILCFTYGCGGEESASVSAKKTIAPITGPVTVNIPVNRFIVTSDLNSAKDLLGGSDQDTPQDRQLVIQWNFGALQMDDAHVFVDINGQNPKGKYLGGSRGSHFVWKPNGERTSAPFQQGPQFGNKYRFIVKALRQEQVVRILESDKTVSYQQKN